jgi:aminopeptidase N
VTTALGLLYEGELAAAQLVDCGVQVLRRETADSVVEPLLGRLVEAADEWAPRTDRDALLTRVADLCITLARHPHRRVAALRGLAQSATTPEQLDTLAAEATDADLRWRRLTRLAELDVLDDTDVEKLLAEDPNPDAWLSALVARTARAADEAKAQAWQTVVDERRVPPNAVRRVGRSFWRPGQEALVTPYAERYLESLASFGGSGMIWGQVFSRAFYPWVGGGEDFLERLGAAADQDGVSPLVSKNVREYNDRRRRRDAARNAG